MLWSGRLRVWPGTSARFSSRRFGDSHGSLRPLVRLCLTPNTYPAGFFIAGLGASAHPGRNTCRSYEGLVTLTRQLRQLLGSPLPAFSSVENPHVWLFTVTMHGTSSDGNHVEAVMMQTGLFAYVQQNA